MDRHIAFAILLLGSPQLTASTTQQELLVHFAKDASALNEEAIHALDLFLASAPIQGDYHFTVEGHTDSDGSGVYNDTLASARAKTVRDYLLHRGAAPELVDIAYRGKRKPVASNANEAGMSLNRRVRITFTRNVFTDTDELRQALREGSVQHFTVNPERDTVLTGKAGSTVAFRAGSFEDAHGKPVSAPVVVELTEALGALEMVAYGLSTRSDDRLLETDGMVQVLASDTAGNAVRLRSDAPMTVTMPAPVLKPRMQLFLSSTGTNWTVASTPALPESVYYEFWKNPRPMPPVFSFKLPKYKEDQHGRPLRPVQPVMPRVPQLSPERSYVRKDPWWSFIRPRVMEANTQKAFAQAESRYATGQKRYQARLDRYHQENAEFPAAAERYTIRIEHWNEQKKLEKEQWDREVYQPAVRRHDSLAAPLAAKYRADLAAWEKEANIRLEQYEQWAKSTRSASIEDLSNYVFSTTRLGWINCDRFYTAPSERMQQVAVQVEQPSDAHVYLVFTEMRMLLNMGLDENGDHISPLIPVDQPAVFFAFTVINGRTQLCVQPVKGNEKPVLEFTPSTVAEVGRRLAELAGT